jgi:TolB-like protein/tetratricopeptide (TPR) repeat protein
MADIFLSYATEDRPRIEPLARAFEAAGLSVWWDRRIGTGSSFDVVIERELDRAGCVVVVWSRHSIDSEWVRNEAAEGAERDILVPIQIDDVRPPLAFRRRQTAQLLQWPNGAHAQSLLEVVDSIRRITGKSAPTDEAAQSTQPSPERTPIVIAVLPLTDRTAERNLGYLCEGLAEDLMSALFSIAGLRVLSSTDTFAFKDSRANTRDIGASLGATVVLEGSVQHADVEVVVSVRLVEVASGVTIYSQRFQRGLENVFQLQAKISSDVVDGLRRQLGLTGTNQPVAQHSPRNALAYQLLKDAQEPSRLDFGNSVLLKTATALECAIALDPGFGRAYFELAYCYLNLDVSSGGRENALAFHAGRYAKAEAVLAQLEAHDPNDPAAWDIRVDLESDMATLAERCTDLILRGERVHAYPHPTGMNDVRSAYARALAHSGLHREAFLYYATIDRPQEPNLYTNWLHASGCLVAIGEFDRAVALCERIRAAAPHSYFVASTWEFIARCALGDLEGAAHVPPDLPTFNNPLRALVLATARGDAVDIDAVESQVVSPDYFPHEMTGYALLAIGEIERGLNHLELAVKYGARERHWMAFRLPILRTLFPSHTTQHPRYRALLASLRLDLATREKLRSQAAALTPITGVDVGPPLSL